MSRLIVKNLPTYVTPARLREHFEKGGPGGTITDVKVSSKSDGTSRRFGFIGFKTNEEAQKAQQYFDRTFIDTTKISVNFSEGAKDAPAPRPHKRRRVDTDAPENIASTSTSNVKDTTSPKKQDKNLDEFMKVMKPKKGPAWANEEQVEPIPVPQEPEVVKDVQPEGLSDLEWMRQRMSNAVDKEERVFEQDDDEPMAPRLALTAAEPAPPLSAPAEPIDATKETILQTARLFVRNLAFTCTDEELSELFSPFGHIAQGHQTFGNVDPLESDSNYLVCFSLFKDVKQYRDIRPSGMLILCGIPIVEIFLIFSLIGYNFEIIADDIPQIHTPRDPVTKQHKGLAYVTFARPADALAAYEALDKKSFQGRLLHILAAVDRKGKPEVVEGEGRHKSLKEEKSAKRKAMAGQEFNWSMLYMNSDAVASSIAARMNIDKSEILNPESGDNAAVKLALAETHIIQETKAYLESQGVLLSSFSSRARSNTTILVKNIPFGTTEDTIRELFEPYGELSRVLVPPAGTIAVVEYETPDDAAKGFRAVAYRRLGNSIIYLEKGPLGMFIEGFTPPTKGTTTSAAGASASTSAIRVPEQIADALDASEPTTGEQTSVVQGGSTLYIKNLAFATTQERLHKIFSHLPSFSFARVQTKPDPKRPEVRLSMGYGFLGFKDVEGAKKAMKSVQGFVLDGHALHVSFAGRGADEVKAEAKEKEGVSAKSRTTKMIVKNVPFEATKKDIRDLFGSHGHLKSVRLPKKFDSRSRGFAFLEFVSRHEAENAYNTLRHTHLLGRHLVLEWAEEAEQDLDVLRKKAGVGFGGGKKDMPGRKRKLHLGGKDVEDDGLDYE
ncbi:hypothetical protein D9613_002318 [Agrocybe pediades]|uniref:Multiple RNA-binding domain-containing protein 1 n=1 Tax=Agrocybe pediades TaxID=84607 RepID=A0A8H4VUH0_9AGAR|nr:hypothetical protein D9613_002318 [Agrocybe pediades]